MNLIEDNNRLQDFLRLRLEFNTVLPIWSAPMAHECNSSISFVYLRTDNTDYIVNFNHIDANRCDLFDFNEIVCPNTLILGNRYLKTNAIDYEWAYFEEHGIPFSLNDVSGAAIRWHRTDFRDINDCIPLMRWYEILQKVPTIKHIKSWYRKYSEGISILGEIEGAGVCIDPEKFIKRFNFDPQFIDSQLGNSAQRVYTKYNPYTVTGRPSNRHLGVNWSALNKNDGTRSVLISRFDGGSLVQFDYESYHIRLIARIIGYDIPEGVTAHQYLANYYGVDVDQAKLVTFRYLYGGLDEFALTIPFFKRVNGYVVDLYRKFVISGELTTPLYGRKIHFSRIEAPNEQKVFNYLLQALESEVNYKRMATLVDSLKNKQSKLILYTYDAFLIDVHPQERAWLLKDFQFILEMGGFPVRMYEGSNYDDLVKL